MAGIEPVLLKPKMAAERLGVPLLAVRKMMQDGTLPTVWIRTMAMVRVADVDAYIAVRGHADPNLEPFGHVGVG